MKTHGLLFALLMVPFFSANAQLNTDKKSTSNGDGENIPKTHIKVNKEYDKDGNLVKYDSVYTYFYSNADTSNVSQDSMFENFSRAFYNQLPDMNRDFFNNFFFNDSIMSGDFYSDDFFTNHFRDNMDTMNKLFEQMDSVKNQFFDQQYEQHKTAKQNKKL